MTETDKPTIENHGGFRQELHDIGVDINHVLPESELNDRGDTKKDKAGVTYAIKSLSTSNPLGFLYSVERLLPSKDFKSWTWHRSLQEDPEQQVVKEIRDGIELPERRGFNEADIVGIRKSIAVFKGMPADGEA